MSMWERIQNSPNFHKVLDLYNDNFPLAVRSVCAQWIEERIKAEQHIHVYDPQYDQYAVNFLQNLIQQVDQENLKYSSPATDFMWQCLTNATLKFQQSIYDPRIVYGHIRGALIYEHQVLNEFDMSENSPTVVDIIEIMKELCQRMNLNTEQCGRYKHEYNQAMLRYDVSTQYYMQGNYNSTTDAADHFLKMELYNNAVYNTITNGLNHQRNEIITKNRTTIGLIEELQRILVHDHLGKWKRDQALSDKAAQTIVGTLNKIQSWFKVLDVYIDTIRSDMQTCSSATDLQKSSAFQEAYSIVTNIKKNLILYGFIVEKQPPQVITTNTNFDASVRHLLANVRISSSNPNVTVSILSESQAKQQQQNPFILSSEVSGTISNNIGALVPKPLSCNLTNMQLKKIDRAGRRGKEYIMDEKYALLFATNIRTSDMDLNVSVLSLPVIVNSNTNQKLRSLATITWDNAFAEVNRIPFKVVDSVPWTRMAAALSMTFFEHTGRALSEENLCHLSEIFFQHEINMNVDFRPITFSQFCKSTMPERDFKFWNWFHAAIELTCEYFRNPWVDGLIIGFISKQSVRRMLSVCAPGTFLLRFSDSVPGGITVAWIEKDANNVPQVLMLDPCRHNDLQSRSLGNRIKDLDQFTTLYPATPKDQAFGRYYTPPKILRNGYVRHEIRQTATAIFRGISGSNFRFIDNQ